MMFHLCHTFHLPNILDNADCLCRQKCFDVDSWVHEVIYAISSAPANQLLFSWGDKKGISAVEWERGHAMSLSERRSNCFVILCPTTIKHANRQ